jgi:hypothetical protein
MMPVPIAIPGLAPLLASTLACLSPEAQRIWAQLSAPPTSPACLAWLTRQLLLAPPPPTDPLGQLTHLHQLAQIRAEAPLQAPPAFAPSPFRHACIPALLRYLSQQMDYFAWHGLAPEALAARSQAFEAGLFALAGIPPHAASGIPLPRAQALLQAAWARYFHQKTQLQSLTPARLDAALAQGLPVCVLGSDGLEIPGDATLHATLLLPGAAGPDGGSLQHFDPLSGRTVPLDACARAHLPERLGPAALILMPQPPCPPCA